MSVIPQIIQLFTEAYPGRFETSEHTIRVWKMMLRDIDGESIMAAAMHLASSPSPFPPTIGQVREKAMDIKDGELVVMSGAESWARILDKVQDRPMELDDLEKAALKTVGSIFDLRRSENPSIDRAHYIKAYDALVTKQRILRCTLPEVRAVADYNAPALPAREAVQKLTDDEIFAATPATPDEIAKMIEDAGGVGKDLP